jgi:hypothetical protein
VNAVVEPPTAPTLVSPLDGALLGTAPPVLVVANATSPEGLALTYTFELFASGVATPIERVLGVLPGATETSWTPTVVLPDGSYEWRSQAVDSEGRAGPWMATARFHLAVDQPPLPPQGLVASAGDGRVALSWTASPEPDVAGYRVYRGLATGGPYELVAAPVSPAYEDLGLTNGVTVYYVVTAQDGRFESAPSAEVAATPSAEPPFLAADVRIVPDRLRAECLFSRCATDLQVNPLCLPWLFLAIELEAGRDPRTIDPDSIRLAGGVRPDHTYGLVLDLDFDGRPELWVRFALGDVVPVLHVGANVLALTATAGAEAVRGETTLVVGSLAPELVVSPKVVSLRSSNLALDTRLTFASCLRAADVDVLSIRLNGQVPVNNVVSVQGSRLTVRFAGSALRAALRPGKQTLSVTGVLGGEPFVAFGEITVTE